MDPTPPPQSSTSNPATTFAPEHRITSVEQLEALAGVPRAAQQAKVLGQLDHHCRRWIEASPFLFIASAAADGTTDVSPKGDPPGFVRILDDSTLAIPDRVGNRRVDTFHNVLENPHVGVAFLVPGRGETLRVRGRGDLVTQPELLASMAERGRAPKLALVVHIDAVMFHCGKAPIRSGIWEPDRWPEVDHLASYAECLNDQTPSDETLQEMETRFATWHDGNELY